MDGATGERTAGGRKVIRPGGTPAPGRAARSGPATRTEAAARSEERAGGPSPEGRGGAARLGTASPGNGRRQRRTEDPEGGEGGTERPRGREGTAGGPGLTSHGREGRSERHRARGADGGRTLRREATGGLSGSVSSRGSSLGVPSRAMTEARPRRADAAERRERDRRGRDAPLRRARLPRRARRGHRPRGRRRQGHGLPRLRLEGRAVPRRVSSARSRLLPAWLDAPADVVDARVLGDARVVAAAHRGVRRARTRCRTGSR